MSETFFFPVNLLVGTVGARIIAYNTAQNSFDNLPLSVRTYIIAQTLTLEEETTYPQELSSAAKVRGRSRGYGMDRLAVCHKRRRQPGQWCFLRSSCIKQPVTNPGRETEACHSRRLDEV